MFPASLFRKLALGAILLGAVSVPSIAQVTFYGAPPPSDFTTNIGANGTSALRSDARPGESRSSSGGGEGKGLLSPLPLLDLPLIYTFAVREGFDDNVFTTQYDRKSSFYTNVSGGIRYDFGGPRLQLSTNLGGGVTYYYTRPGDKVDYNGQFGLNLTYLATQRLTLTANTTTAYLSQPDLTIVGGTNRENGDYLYSNTSLSAAYQWSEKFSTVTGYNFAVIYYVDNSLNDSQGRIEQTISQSARWLLLPKTTVVAEYRANPITYFGADLDAFNQFFLVGFDQIFNPRLTWTLRAGLQVGLNDNPVDGTDVYVGPYGESLLSYQFGPASTLTWNLRYGTEASGLTDVTQRETFRTGLGVTHKFTSRITGTLGFNYQTNHYDQGGVIESFQENIFDFSLGASFAVNRYLSLQAGYQYVADLAPDYSGRAYNRNVVFIGASTTF